MAPVPLAYYYPGEERHRDNIRNAIRQFEDRMGIALNARQLESMEPGIFVRPELKNPKSRKKWEADAAGGPEVIGGRLAKIRGGKWLGGASGKEGVARRLLCFLLEAVDWKRPP